MNSTIEFDLQRRRASMIDSTEDSRVDSTVGFDHGFNRVFDCWIRLTVDLIFAHKSAKCLNIVRY